MIPLKTATNTTIMSFKCSLGNLSKDEVCSFSNKLQSSFLQTKGFSYEVSKENNKINMEITKRSYFYGIMYQTFFTGHIRKLDCSWELAGKFKRHKMMMPVFLSFYVALLISIIILSGAYVLLNYHDAVKPIIGCLFGLVCVFILQRNGEKTVLDASIITSAMIKDCIKANLQNYILDL